MKFFRFPKHHRKVLVGLAIAFVLFSVGFWRVTKSPKFCLSCHYMHPYYKAWQESTHSDVPCVKCHYEPGWKAQIEGELAGFSQLVKYATRTFSPKPKAQISDASCLRSGCHEERLLKGQIAFRDNIIFDHANHLGQEVRGMKLRCTTCHSQIVQGPHMVVTDNACFMCHFKGREDGEMVGTCLSCHGPPAKIIERAGASFDHSSYVTEETDCLSCHTNVTQGTGEVPAQRCYSCHVERDLDRSDKKFIHKTHVTDHKVECFECHVVIKHGKPAEGLDPLLTMRCLDCHSNQHSVAEQMYSGIGIDSLPNAPSAMFLSKVNCNGCHESRVNLHAGHGDFEMGAASAEECVTCHGEGYDEMMVMWQEMTQEMVDDVNSSVDEIGKLLEGVTEGEARQHYEKAVKAIRFVEKDGSMGVHNLEYAHEAIGLAETELEAAKAAIEAGAGG